MLKLALAARPIGIGGGGPEGGEPHHGGGGGAAFEAFAAAFEGLGAGGGDEGPEEPEEEWPPTAEELRASDFVRVLRTVGTRRGRRSQHAGITSPGLSKRLLRVGGDVALAQVGGRRTAEFEAVLRSMR